MRHPGRDVIPRISSRRIALLCSEGRIPGAQRVGASWGIPEGAEKPPDARIKSGKYINPKKAGASQ
ncbi:MAG: DNA-binding protein [Clostridiales Family XIII bacterium]|nr:DNA-binding protein [Clostridiales Family XIII bacterium]